MYENLKANEPKNGFTIGIDDDVTHLSLPVDEDFRIAPEGLTAVFFGLGALLIKTVSRVEV